MQYICINVDSDLLKQEVRKNFAKSTLLKMNEQRLRLLSSI